MKKLILIIFISAFIAACFFLSACKKPQDYPKLKIDKEKEKDMVRQPAVAGSFYPADKDVLKNQIDNFLDKAKVVPAKQDLKILIVPHAGYDYSGLVAAWGFKQIKKDYKTAILLGSSHSSYFSKAAVWNEGSWQTPLGFVDIDKSFADKLISENKKIQSNLNGHLNEHSLEVEVPFIQQVLPGAKIVPILLGQSDDSVLQILADVLAKNFNQETLLVVSSDLSHYPPYEVANKVDKETIDAILSADVDEFGRVIKKNLDQSGTDTCACGADAVKVAMLMAKKLKANEIKLLKYANSGDTGGDKSRVVGYAAVGFYENLKFKMKNEKFQLKIKNLISKDGQKELLRIARETLESYLKNKKIPEFKIEDEVLNQPLSAFVTLRIDGNLRGCIGEFEPKKPLYKVVQDKVIDAALHDSRFSPVDFNELKNIKIEISVLSTKVKIDDWRKIKLRKHGVVIQKGLRGGTFLPQVADDTGWTLEEFLENLCSGKAGLPKDCYKDKNTKIFTYTAQVFEEE